MSRYCRAQGQVLSDTHTCESCDPKGTEGVYIRHAYPGDVIELVVWRSGEEPMIRKLSDKHAMNLLADLAQALRSNGK